MKNWVIDQFRTGRLKNIWSQIITIIINNLVIITLYVIITGIGVILLPLIYLSIIKSIISPIKEMLLFFLLLTPLILYLFSGYILLPTKHIFTDFFSVIPFGIIGIMIWIYCMNHPGYDALHTSWWTYAFYTGGMGMYDILIGENDQYNYLRILYSIIPVLLSFCGLEIKRTYNKKQLDFVVILKYIFKN